MPDVDADGGERPESERPDDGARRHGRHAGASASATRRVTRPATNAPAHRARAHEAQAVPGAATPSAPQAAPVPQVAGAHPEPVLPRSADDVDVGWGGRPEPDDDDRILREVPPHWQ